MLGVPVELTLREPFFLFVVPARRPEHVAPGVGRLFLFPVGSVCFGLPKGIFCCSTKTSGEQILFSERAFDTVYDTVF